MQIFLERFTQFLSEYFISLLLGVISVFIFWDLLVNSKKFLLFIIRVFPKNYKLHYKLGYLYSKKSECRDDAEKELRMAISLDPDKPDPYYSLARILWEKPNWDDEIKTLCNTMRERFPDNPWTYLFLGYSYEKSNDKAKAESNYRKAIDVDLKIPASYDYLINLLHQDGRFDEAQQYYLQATKFLPRNNEKYHLYSALHYHVDGKHSEAVAAYKRVIHKNPKNMNALHNIGILQYQELNQPKEAEQTYRRIIQLHPKDPEAYFQLGLVLHEKFQDYEEADSMFQKALEFNPQDEYSLYNLACIKAIAKDADTAFKYLKEAIQNGFDKDFAWEDPELESLQNDPRFVEIVGRK